MKKYFPILIWILYSLLWLLLLVFAVLDLPPGILDNGVFMDGAVFGFLIACFIRSVVDIFTESKLIFRSLNSPPSGEDKK